MRYVAPQEPHDSRIIVKFGSSAVPNFTLGGGYLGFPAQKNRKIAKKCQLFRPPGANPLPYIGEIRRVYAGNRSTEAVNIWCHSVGKLGIYTQKNRDEAFPPRKKISKSPSSKTIGQIEKIKRAHEHPLSSCKAWWRSASAAARRREKEKFGVFVFFCLFVTLYILNLHQITKAALTCEIKLK